MTEAQACYWGLKTYEALRRRGLPEGYAFSQAEKVKNSLSPRYVYNLTSQNAPGGALKSQDDPKGSRLLAELKEARDRG